MAEDSAQILVLAAGDVYVAPYGATAPTGATAALSNEFKKLGYIDDAGPSFTPSTTSSNITGWQSPYPLSVRITGRVLDMAFTLMQLTEESLALAFGGGTWTGTPGGTRTWDPPAASANDQRAVVIEAQDGAKSIRVYVPLAQVSSVGAITFTKDQPASVPITMSAVVQSSSQKIAQVFTAGGSFALA